MWKMTSYLTLACRTTKATDFGHVESNIRTTKSAVLKAGSYGCYCPLSTRPCPQRRYPALPASLVSGSCPAKTVSKGLLSSYFWNLLSCVSNHKLAKTQESNFHLPVHIISESLHQFLSKIEVLSLPDFLTAGFFINPRAHSLTKYYSLGKHSHAYHFGFHLI